MNFSSFIARRYLFSKTNSNAVNIISFISTLGFAVGSFALIVVLSVYNGFEHLVLSLYNSFDPDIRIESNEGKVYSLSDIPMERIGKMDAVWSRAPVLEENVALSYGDKQSIAFIKCTSEDFLRKSGMDTLLLEGSLRLKAGNEAMAVIGYGVANLLAVHLDNDFTKLGIIVPRRGDEVSLDPEAALKKSYVFCSGIFSVDDNVNGKYVLLPYSFGLEMLDYKEGTVTALELRLKKGAKVEDVKKELEGLIDTKKFTIKTKYELQEVLFRVFNSERWATYFILIFIISIAAFNVIGSLTMLIIDKQKDIYVLQSMGADKSLVRRIFVKNGLLLSSMGGAIGLVLGLLFCYLQMQYGFIKIGGADLNTLIIHAYPVKIKVRDIVLVVVSNALLGLLVSWIPSRIRQSV